MVNFFFRFQVFLYWLPKMLMMKRPKIENSQDVNLKYIKLRLCKCASDGTDDVRSFCCYCLMTFLFKFVLY